MKRLLLLAVFAVAGCDTKEPPLLTPDQYKAQYEARQVAANEKLKQNSVIIPRDVDVIIGSLTRNRPEVKLTIICLQGIQYYYQKDGWSVWLAPVMNKYSRAAEGCDQ